MKAQRISKGHYIYNGWEIEKMESGQWNMKPVYTEFWTDAASTLNEAKSMINNWSK